MKLKNRFLLVFGPHCTPDGINVLIRNQTEPLFFHINTQRSTRGCTTCGKIVDGLYIIKCGCNLVWYCSPECKEKNDHVCFSRPELDVELIISVIRDHFVLLLKEGKMTARPGDRIAAFVLLEEFRKNKSFSQGEADYEDIRIKFGLPPYLDTHLNVLILIDVSGNDSFPRTLINNIGVPIPVSSLDPAGSLPSQ